MSSGHGVPSVYCLHMAYRRYVICSWCTIDISFASVGKLFGCWRTVLRVNAAHHKVVISNDTVFRLNDQCVISVAGGESLSRVSRIWGKLSWQPGSWRETACNLPLKPFWLWRHQSLMPVLFPRSCTYSIDVWSHRLSVLFFTPVMWRKSHDRCIEEVFSANVNLYSRLYHKNSSVDVADLCCTVLPLVSDGV